MADRITDKAVTTAASRIADLLTMLNVDPDERPEHGGPTTAEMLARAALAAALPVLNTTRDSEVVQDQRIEIARALGLADDIVFDLDYLLNEITGLREANELKRARLIELGPIIDDLTHGGVAAELVSLRAEVAELRRRDAEFAASLRGEQGE